MTRKRIIDPAFFTSKPLSELPIPTMVTFAGLWCYADDYGRGEDDATMVKAAIWPRRPSYTEKKVAADLDALVAKGLVCRYAVAGYPLLHIPTWTEHQKISHKTDSKLPPCPSHDDLLYAEFLRDSGGPLQKYRRGSGAAPEPFPRNAIQGNSTQSSSSEPAAALPASRAAAPALAALSAAKSQPPKAASA